MSAVVIPMVSPKSPQTEDGFTRIANELLDAIVRAGFSSRQWAVVMAVVRKTYGFNKKADDIGLGQLAAMTGIDKAHLSRTVRELADAGVLHRMPGVYAHTLSLNKNYESWGLLKEQRLPKEQRLLKEQPPIAERATGSVAESATPPVAERATTKDNSSKDNYQKTTPKEIPAPQAAGVTTCEARVAKPKGKAAMTAELQTRFDRFYAAYPKKVDRKDAERAFAKIAPDEDLLAVMLAAIEAGTLAGQFADRTYIKHPATWLNKGSWMDEIATGYSGVELEVIGAYNASLGEALGNIDADIYEASRASRIQDFLTLSEKPNFWHAFFPWVRDKCQLPGYAGFDWLISRKGFSVVKGGQHEEK